MANQKYIKVTPRGETKPCIVLATLKDFYISQGAKIERPTDEEVYEAIPQERPKGAPVKQPANVVDNKRVAQLESELRKVRESNEELNASNAEKSYTIAKLEDKLNAAETTIAESERIIESLRKELAKSTAKGKAKDAE